MNFKYTVIESENSVAEKLNERFESFADYSCVGSSFCYDESMNLILQHSPDMVFIDVDGNGDRGCVDAINFVNELYNYISELPRFIALSSSKVYAYDCLKNNFFDYILKPINEFDLRKSVSRFSKKPELNGHNKLCLKSYKDYRFIDINEIRFLKADNNATDFFMNDGSTVSAYKTLKSFELILPKNFIRIHNSYIINRDYVSRIHFGKSKCNIKNCTYIIPFSKSYKRNVNALEQTLSKTALSSLN